MTALADICVLDLSRVLAGPYCTQLLGDYGADVIKVEQPGSGDGTRGWGPPWIGDQSAYFLSANRNKRSITLNLKSEAGRSILRRLAATADVVIENFRVGTAARMGIDYESLAAVNPGIIYCSISGYGQEGPGRDRPGYDFIIQATGGIMSITGPAEGEPYKVGVAIADITASLFAASAILAALHERERSGHGQYIDVALFDSQLAWLVNIAHNYFATGEAPDRYGNAHPNIVPYQTFATADGHVAVGIGTDDQYRRFCELAERPDLWADQRFRANAGRVEHREKLVPLLADLFHSRPTAEWLALLQKEGIPVGLINDIPTALNSPEAQARGMVQTVDHPTLGPLQVLGPVAQLSRTPADIRRAPPTLGFDTEAVLQERLGMAPAEIEQLREEGVL